MASGAMPVRPRQLHREVRGEVAVLGVGRSLDLDGGSRRVVGQRRQRAALDGSNPGALDGLRGPGRGWTVRSDMGRNPSRAGRVPRAAGRWRPLDLSGPQQTTLDPTRSVDLRQRSALAERDRAWPPAVRDRTVRPGHGTMAWSAGRRSTPAVRSISNEARSPPQPGSPYRMSSRPARRRTSRMRRLAWLVVVGLVVTAFLVPTAAPVAAGHGAHPSATPSDEPTGTPSDEPTGTPSGKPTGTPTTPPSGTPSTPPTPTPSSPPSPTPSAPPSATPSPPPSGSPSLPPSGSPEHPAERIAEHPAERVAQHPTERRTQLDAERPLHVDADEHRSRPRPGRPATRCHRPMA